MIWFLMYYLVWQIVAWNDQFAAFRNYLVLWNCTWKAWFCCLKFCKDGLNDWNYLSKAFYCWLNFLCKAYWLKFLVKGSCCLSYFWKSILLMTIKRSLKIEDCMSKPQVFKGMRETFYSEYKRTINGLVKLLELLSI